MNDNKKKAIKLIFKTVIYAFAVFGVIFILVLLGVLGLMSPKSKLLPMPKNTVLNIDFNLSYSDVRQDDFFAEFTDQSVYSIFDLVQAINIAATDEHVKAISGNLNVTTLSLSQIQDIAEALQYFKSTGKKTYLFSNGLGSFGQGLKEYYLAALFDEVWLQPHSDVGITGIDIEVPFFKNIFNKVGVEPEFYTRYEYKTAVASFLNSDFTPAYKEELSYLGGTIFDIAVKDIGAMRKLEKQTVIDAINRAPLFAEDALKNGFIDRIGYRTEFEKNIKEKNQAEFYKMTDYMAHFENLQNKSLPKIIFMVLEGVIEDGQSSNNPLKDSIIGSETVLKQLDELKNEENIKALVLRINSPGGSYAASDEIRNALVAFKEEKNIPIIVSMSSYAASGGYFISLAGDYIMANPATITGSIGVLGGKIVLEELFKKLDIYWGDIKFGKNAGILSMNHKFSDSEREVFNLSLDEVYKDFTSKVSETRKIDLDEMDLIARGRVWVGISAKENHLIDEIGGLQSALLKAKELAHISQNDKFSLIYYPRRETFQEKLTKFIETGGNLPMMKVFESPDEIKAIYRLKHNTVLPPFVIRM